MELEQKLLGKLMCGDAANLLTKIQQLQESHFEHTTHGRIFSAIKERAVAGVEPSSVVLAIHLPESLFDGHGGNHYLAELAGMGSMVFGLGDIANAIIEKHTRRQFVAKVEAVLRGEIIDSGEAINDLMEELSILRDSAEGWQLKNFQEMASIIVQEMELEPKISSTGLKNLDEAMEGGFQSTRSYYFAGDSGVGKTVLLGTISYNLNQANIPHLFIAAEMGARQIHQRQMARALGEHTNSFIFKRRDSKFISKAISHVGHEGSQGLYLDAPAISFERLKQVLGHAVTKYGIKGLVLDYIQLVTGKPRGESDAAFIGEVAQWLAAFCGKNDIWLCSVAQLNRDGEILGSGGIKRAADQIYHMKQNSAGGVYLECDKSRYTAINHVGSEAYPAFRLNKLGAFFEEV